MSTVSVQSNYIPAGDRHCSTPGELIESFVNVGSSCCPNEVLRTRRSKPDRNFAFAHDGN